MICRRLIYGNISVILLMICLMLPLTVSAKTDDEPCIFLAPQSMNQANEVTVPVYTQNFPKDNDGLCGIEFKFTYDTEHFTLKTDEEGRPLPGSSTAMLVQDTDKVEVSQQDGIVSVSLVDFSGEKSLVLRDGPLFFFTLIPKNPDLLWNSDDYYPLHFLPSSVNLIVMDKQSYSISGIEAEGIDTYVGGYNAFPDFKSPRIEDKTEFCIDSSSVWVNGKEIPNDAPVYENDREVMIPIRFLAEALKMELLWNGETHTVSVYWPYSSAYLTMNDQNVYINARRRQDLSKAEIMNDRAYIGLSVVQAFFGDALEIQRDENRVKLEFKR